MDSEYLLADQRRMSLAKNYFAWQGRLVRRELGQRVLEIGCGIGNFTEQLLDREAVLGIDIDPACIEELRRRYADCENIGAEVGGSAKAHAEFQPDSCVCLNVLEHIEDDCAALMDMAQALPRGGKIVLMVPAFPALYGPIDRNLEHCRRYTRRSLTGIAAAAGLAVCKLHYVNSAGFFGWAVNARLLRRAAQSKRQILFFDRYVVPVLSRLEGWVTPPFGQSLFAVLQKP